MGMMELRHRILLSAGDPLPPYYKRVEYIQSVRYAFIAIPYVPVQNDEIKIAYMVDDIASSMNCLFSAGTDSRQLIALGYDRNGLQRYYCRFFSAGSASELWADVSVGIWQTMTVSAAGTFSVNGVSITVPYEGALDGSNTNLFIFRRRNTNNNFIGKLRSFAIRNAGTLKVNLVPCIRKTDGKAGAYETVSGRFYSSESYLGEFYPGPAI